MIANWGADFNGFLWRDQILEERLSLRPASHGQNGGKDVNGTEVSTGSQSAAFAAYRAPEAHFGRDLALSLSFVRLFQYS
jgi:hypothetical protein